MRKTLITLLLVLASMFTNAQNMIGSSFQEVKSFFKSAKIERLESGMDMIIAVDESATKLYAFNKYNICFMYVIFPKPIAFGYYVNSYNTYAAILDSKTWRLYENNETYIVSYLCKDDICGFYYTLEND